MTNPDLLSLAREAAGTAAPDLETALRWIIEARRGDSERESALRAQVGTLREASRTILGERLPHAGIPDARPLCLRLEAGGAIGPVICVGDVRTAHAALAATPDDCLAAVRREALTEKRNRYADWLQYYGTEIFPAMRPAKDESLEMQAYRSNCSAAMGRHILGRLIEETDAELRRLSEGK